MGWLGGFLIPVVWVIFPGALYFGVRKLTKKSEFSVRIPVRALAIGLLFAPAVIVTGNAHGAFALRGPAYAVIALTLYELSSGVVGYAREAAIDQLTWALGSSGIAAVIVAGVMCFLPEPMPLGDGSRVGGDEKNRVGLPGTLPLGQSLFRAAVVWLGVLLAMWVCSSLLSAAVKLLPLAGVELLLSQFGMLVNVALVVGIVVRCSRWLGLVSTSKWILVGATWMALNVALVAGTSFFWEGDATLWHFLWFLVFSGALPLCGLFIAFWIVRSRGRPSVSDTAP